MRSVTGDYQDSQTSRKEIKSIAYQSKVYKVYIYRTIDFVNQNCYTGY